MILRAVFEGSHDAIVLLDDEAMCVDANPGACRIIGLDREALVGLPIGRFIPPADDFGSLFGRLVAEGRLAGDFCLRRPDGGERHVEYLATARVLPGRHLAIFRDVSDRRATAEALRESEARFSTFFRHSPTGISITTTAGRYVDMNDRYLAMLGYARAELIGKTVAEVGIWVDNAERELYIREMEARGGGIRDVACRWRTKSGATRRVQVSVEPMQVGGEPCYLTVANDVTERLRAEEALRDTTETLGAVFETSPAAIVVIDMDARVKLWNPAAERIFGWLAEETLGGPAPHVPEESLPFVMDLVTSGASVRGRSVWRRRRDGSAIEVLLSTAPLRDGAGSLVGSVGILLDLSEQRQLEHQLLESQKMEAIGRLAGGVAHDFNNMLAAITGFASIIEADLPAGDPIRADLSQIQKAADRAGALTRQLLAFSRRQVMELEILDPAALLAELAPMLRRLIGDDVHLATHVDGNAGSVRADRGQLEQVILNLVVNARDAMPRGGQLSIDVGRSAPPTPVDGEASAFVIISVADTGTGMAPDVMSNVFEPFYTTKDKGKGTGLGLSTVYGIVRQIGGYVTVESEVGRGSAFRVHLPVCNSDAPETPTHRVRTDRLLDGTETILLVEDEEMVRAVAVSILRRHGYTVLPAQNGGEALLLCEQHPDPIQLLLTDVMLPVSNGPEVAARLRKLRPELRVVYMSGYAGDALPPQGTLDAPLVEKPFTPETLLSQIRRTLDRR
ncbi:MAG: PAS domain S-box protein [Acidobacteriota bacterium]